MLENIPWLHSADTVGWK